MKQFIKLFTLSLTILTGSLGHAVALDYQGSFAFQQEYSKLKNVKARYRQRVKADLTASHNLNDFSLLTVGFASGLNQATSTYITLGNGFEPTTVDLNQANAAFTFWKKTTVARIGKMKNPLQRIGDSQLNWDSDVRPEGIAISYSHPEFLADIAGFVLDENSTSEDVYVFAGDIFFPVELSEKANIKIGLGAYLYTQLKNGPVIGSYTTTGGNSSTTNGTGATATTVYANHYSLLTPGLELNTRLANIPFQIYLDFAYNVEAEDDNLGWTLGVQLGKVSGWKDFAFTGYFLRKEANAVLASLTHSDFYYQQTGTQGFGLSGKMGLFEKADLSLTWFSTDRIKNPKARDNRVQLTASMGF